MNEIPSNELFHINGNVVKIDRYLNEFKFPSNKHAKIFAEIYRQLAVEKIRDIEKNIDHYVIRKDGELTKEERLQHALRYFKGGGVYPGDKRSSSKVLDRTQMLYKQYKDSEFLEKIKNSI